MPNLLSLKFFVPELILSATVIVLILSALFQRLAAHAGKIAIAGLLLSLFFTAEQAAVGNPPLFWGLIILDHPAVFFKVIFAITAVLVSIFSCKSDELVRFSDRNEYFSLIVGSVIGMNLLAMADNLLMIYLSLEFVSLMSYLLVGCVTSSRSKEAALKYVLYGAVASGVFLYGASLYYGSSGSLEISNFKFQSSNFLPGLFMLAGFLYKIAAVPMHAWCPDAYEGAPTPVTAFLSVAPKAAGFAVLMRVSHELGQAFSWPMTVAVISAATMILGNLAAIPQTNVKRLLAYSSIAHAGYLLMGVACFSQKGGEAVYFYFVAYLIMNLGAFLVVQIVGNFERESIEAYKGLSRRGPHGVALAVAMTVFLLSLTGVPPFVGFIGKFYIFSAVIESKLYWLAIVGIINSVVSLYYYARIIRAMFFDAPAEESPIAVSSLGILLAGLSICTILFGVFWQWLAVLIRQVA